MKMKMQKTFLSRLSEKLDSVYIEYTDNKKGKFIDDRRRLFILLLDHPYFEDKVIELRKKYDIPKKGFKSKQDAFLWEQEDKKRKLNFREDVEKLVSDFKIHNVYHRSMWHFVSDFLTYPEQIKSLLIEKLPLISIIHTDPDREINKYLIEPDSTYIEIFEWTTKRDLDRVWKKITKTKQVKLPFKVSRVEYLARFVWKLTQEAEKTGKKDVYVKNKIANFLRKMGDKRVFGYEDIPIYKKRYKDALSTLRKIE